VEIQEQLFKIQRLLTTVGVHQNNENSFNIEIQPEKPASLISQRMMRPMLIIHAIWDRGCRN
jgi:hypothetical protein